MKPIVYILYLCLLKSDHPMRKAYLDWILGSKAIESEIEAMSFSKSFDARLEGIYEKEQDWALASLQQLENFLRKYINMDREDIRL